MGESKPVPNDLIPRLRLQASTERNGEQGNGKRKSGRFRELATITEKRVTKLTIDLAVFKRLEAEARERGATMSELANDLLDRELQHWELQVIKTPKATKPGEAAEPTEDLSE